MNMSYDDFVLRVTNSGYFSVERVGYVEVIVHGNLLYGVEEVLHLPERQTCNDK